MEPNVAGEYLERRDEYPRALALQEPDLVVCYGVAERCVCDLHFIPLTGGMDTLEHWHSISGMIGLIMAIPVQML